MFANLSNIGWFGDTIAIDQHLHISRMRTLEFQRPMLRATNTGATAIIDHRGQWSPSLPPFTRGVLEAQVQGRTADALRVVGLARRGCGPPGAGRAGLPLGALRGRPPGCALPDAVAARRAKPQRRRDAPCPPIESSPRARRPRC